MSKIERHKDPLWKEMVSDAYKTILYSLRYDGEDIPQLPNSFETDVSENTPERATKAFDFLTSGYRLSVNDVIGNGIFVEKDIDELILIKDIEFYSLCEHHLLPFFGKIHVGYIPGNRILGLSKIPRIVNLFARRLQLQEKLTMQIAHGIKEILETDWGASESPLEPPKGIAVVCEAQHLCMAMRGVQKQGSKTITNAMLGVFKDEDSARAEFMSAIAME